MPRSRTTASQNHSGSDVDLDSRDAAVAHRLTLGQLRAVRALLEGDVVRHRRLVSGVDLQRAGKTFEILTKLDDKAIASWKDTHPAGAERIVAWRKAVAEVEASPDKLPTMAMN